MTSIGGSAFWWCTRLTSVDIPDGVTSIGEGAFHGCTGLTSVKIGSGVTSIGEFAFRGCTGLTSVDIPDGVTSIGIGAFSYCDTIEEFVFLAGVDQYPQDEHGDNYDGLFGDYEESNYIGTYTGTLVKKLHISDSTNPLRFEGSTGDFEPYHLKLKELYIGRELSISEYIPDIFSSTLETAEIGGCLKSDIITSYRNTEYGLKQLGPDNIKTIIYGDSIAEISRPVTTASEIYLRDTTPPVTAEWENSNYVSSILYVPQGTLAVYQNADVWKNFWDIREWNATTDVKSPTIDNADAADISIDGKQVTVTTNNPGTRVQVYNTGGVLVYDGKEGTVNIGTPGLYIIKAGNQTKKLLVK